MSSKVSFISVKPFSSTLYVFCRCGSFSSRGVDIEGSHYIRKIEEDVFCKIENDFDIPTALELENSLDQFKTELLTFYTEIIDLQKMIG